MAAGYSFADKEDSYEGIPLNQPTDNISFFFFQIFLLLDVSVCRNRAPGSTGTPPNFLRPSGLRRQRCAFRSANLLSVNETHRAPDAAEDAAGNG